MAAHPLFEKVLIANRGEIALRICHTLKKLGIKSVAVYSEADANSLHVQRTDEAYRIGNSPAPESYLNIPNIITALRQSGADAVHPGYGFLSENFQFTETLKREGITLIGPSSHAIKVMGDKVEAKKIATAAGVNTVPGYIGIIKDVKHAIEIASDIGFPVIVKAAAGGGGRGMRVVTDPAQMLAAFTSARFEAENCFNDGRVFIEKLISKPRHIEIQILADKYGNTVCLGERECSIQRHHQKVIEEAPSAFINPETRQQMYEQSISLAQNVGYYSAGTIEFIVDQDHKFYFLEMNTRLQVEHCVTELITGIDIVEEMIKIAAGKKLSFSQEDIKLNGWAIECRIYAEDPLRGFLPSSGRITEYVEPAKNPHIRIDSGVGPGNEVSMFYDAMIAKLCTHADTREQAINKMLFALGSFVIRGIAHNISFLEAVISHERFATSNINTDFISEEYPEGFIGANLTSELLETFLATAIYIFIKEQKRAANINNQMNSGNKAASIGTRWIVFLDDKPYPLIIKQVDGGFNIRHDGTRIYIRSHWEVGNKLFPGYVNGRLVHIKIEHQRTGYYLTHAGVSIKVFVRSPRIAELESLMPIKSSDYNQKELLAPLTGQILAIKVNVGDRVKLGDDLVILTAMKMENLITAPHEGIIKKILIQEQEQVNSGQLLIEFE